MKEGKAVAFLKKSSAKNICSGRDGHPLATHRHAGESRHPRLIAFFLLLALTSCGTLPEPFYGNPGAAAARLAIPPAPVLMVPTPTQAMLDDASAQHYAQDLATALVGYDVPCIAGAAVPDNWRLTASAALSGTTVVPAYVITGPDGKVYGKQTGAPVPAAAWANGNANALEASAEADASTLSKTLAAINARIQGANPAALENRPPRIFVGAVTGAPGDGDISLPLNLGRDLPGPDTQVVSDAATADFIVTAQVKAQPDTNGQMLVELDWSVADANRRKIGQVTQLHDLTPADISPYWGDVAAAAATEAAGGIKQVITNAVLKKGN
jgi:hypothetical protein